MLRYQIIEPTVSPVPILVSVPHCGTAFPPELIHQYKPELSAAPDDTDWFVDKLYDFAPAMGITMITAHFSRWVIDLNRDPESKPLYSDGRIITALCPATNFLGESIYVDNRNEVESKEVRRRVEQYYLSYHQKLQELLQSTKERFGKVLLWDCHSIRQYVPTIRKEKFPDLILGDADETSCDLKLIESTINTLSSSGYTFQHNDPFKGGYITRQYGNPKRNEYALQLEMSKVNYMDDAEKSYHPERAEKIRELLKNTFKELIQVLGSDESFSKLNKASWQWTREKTSASILSNSRFLRKNQTDAEKILWARLRNRQFNGLKFRRQHPFEGFILDFYCDELRLAIEVDGGIHRTKENIQYDKLRTEHLNEFGIIVIRFDNDQVVNSSDSVLERISQEVAEIRK